MAFPSKFVHISIFFLAVTALSGIWMRLYYLFPQAKLLPFEYILHGHSHMAILGWTFLAVFLLFLKLFWTNIKRKKQASVIVLVTLIVTVCMFIAFLYEGYATYSIILSVLHIFIEYWVILFIVLSLKNMDTVNKAVKKFIYASCLFLFISTLGPFSLGAIAANGLRDNPLFEMAIYFYLHFQYNGWLYFILFGLFIYFLQQKNIEFSKRWLHISFWFYFISLFPAYFLSVLWYEVGIIGYLASFIGALGQFIAIIIILYVIFSQYKLFLKTFSQHMNISYLFVFTMLISKHLMEFGLLYTPFATLIYDTRSVVIGYLHLTLLGFITMFILNLYQSSMLLNESNQRVKYGVALFLGGFMLQEILLFIITLLDWTNFWNIPYQNELLLVATILLLAGVVTIWTSLMKKNRMHISS